MAVTNRYKGDCRCGYTYGGGNMIYGLRVVNDSSPMADRAGYELDAGASLVFYFRALDIGGGNMPNKCTIAVYYEMQTGTHIRVYQTLGPVPADGTAFTFYATSDGTAAGQPRAGVARLYLRIVKDNSLGTINYDVDTDGALNPPDLNSGTIADSGCLVANALVTDISVAPYPAGATYAHGDTIAVAVQHTPRWGDTNVETVLTEVLDPADVLARAGAPQEIGQSATEQQFAVDDSWAAVAASYGARFSAAGNSAFVPSSGAIAWTKMKASGPTVVQDGSKVKRAAFFAVDPRFTCLHHNQIDDDVFAIAKNNATKRRLATEQMFLASRVVNARGEGVNGLTVTQSLAPVKPGSVVAGSADTATRDGQAGWTPLLAWASPLPDGEWNKSVDVTVPAGADSGAHLLGSTESYKMAVRDSYVEAAASGGDTTHPGTHFVRGQPFTFGGALVHKLTGGLLEADAGDVNRKCIVGRFNPTLNEVNGVPLGGAEFLDANAEWQPWNGVLTAHHHQLTEFVPGSRLYLAQIPAVATQLWAGDYPMFVLPILYRNGWPYGVPAEAGVFGRANDHTHWHPVREALG